MNTAKLFRLFRGYISVEASEGFSERFINLCKNENIPLWDISFCDDKMYFFVYADTYITIKQISKKAGMKTKVHARFGLPFFLKRNKYHLALSIGLVLTVVFIAFMTSRVWTINVSGNKNIFASEIRSVCESYGIKAGAKKSSLDIPLIQNQVLEDMKDRMIWISVNTEGMCAEIQVREIEEVTDDTVGYPCNIVADFDGVITSYRVFSGTKENSKGSGVRKGDLLISGVIQNLDGSSDFIEAGGKICARHDVKINQKLSSAKTRKYLKTQNRYSLSFFGLEIHLGFVRNKDEKEVTVFSQNLEINGVVLPFKLNKYVYSEFEETESENTKLKCLSDYLSSAEDKFRNAFVISEKTKFNDKKQRYEGSFDCIDFIGERVKLNIENKRD